MISRMAMDDIDTLQQEGYEISPTDVIRLNAFGLKVEKSSESSEMFVMQRAAFLGDVVFHQPTIGDEIYIQEISRMYDMDDENTFFLVMSYILSSDQETRPSGIDKVGIQKSIGDTRDKLSHFTISQVWNCLDYVMNGNMVYDDEHAPVKKRNDDDEQGEYSKIKMPQDNDSYPSYQLGLIRQGQALMLGTPQELSKMTTLQLQTLIQYKQVIEGKSGVMKQNHTRCLGEYYEVLEDVKKNSKKKKISKKRN